MTVEARYNLPMHDRAGQVWWQTQAPIDGGGHLVFLVLSSKLQPAGPILHRVLVLEASGGNWQAKYAEGHIVDHEESRVGWFEDFAAARAHASEDWRVELRRIA